jgi:hypothetical protein
LAGPGFPMLHVIVFYIFSDMKWEVLNVFVDIGGIVDHHDHYLNFLFIIMDVHM